MSQTKARDQRVLIPLATLIALIAIWEIAGRIFHFNPVILPLPHDIALAFRSSAGSLFYNTGVTLLEAILGFTLGSGVAVLLAIAFTLSRKLSYAVYPFAVALKSTPLIAIAPLLVLWFGNGLESKVVMSALVAFFPVLVNMVDGLGAFEPEMNDLMRSLSATRWQILRKVKLPSALPNLFSALKVASSLAVVGAVIGEFTGATQSKPGLLQTAAGGSVFLD